MMLNPVFLGLIMAVLAYCDYLLSDYLRRRFKDEPKTITFTSEYRKVTLETSEVMYVESRDTEVWIYATKDRTFRNRTPEHTGRRLHPHPQVISCQSLLRRII